MENGMKELKAWIKAHPEVLIDYSTEDLVNLAVACGFQRSAIAQWVTSRKFKEAI